MFKNRNFIIKLSLTLFIFLLVRVDSYAQEEFLTDYVISYEVLPNGLTSIGHSVTITNRQDDVIATSYTLSLKDMDAFDVVATDQKGKLELDLQVVGDTTNIEVILRNFSIGEGRQNTININYKSQKIAKKVGEIWNINIPKAQSATPTTTQNINLMVPATFGPKIFISPTPTITRSDEKNYIYAFNNENLKDKSLGSITAAYGKFQTLNFKLKYQIENPNRFWANYEIALPPDIEKTQQVAYFELKPAPVKIYKDKDNNVMAVYKLDSKEKKEIEVVGTAQLISRQIVPEDGGNLKDIPADLALKFTQAQPYWEIDSAEVDKIARNLKDDTKSVAENAQKIYEFLVSNYSYDFSIVSRDAVVRHGAAQALIDKKEWGCMEFTDSFIAIARKMGIPAREINGYAISDTEQSRPLSLALKSGDLLHAWPEFYDPKFGWVQIDPTWGNTAKVDYFTKLDTNHLAFVVKGFNSNYPYPAGTYRFEDSGKLVDIAFAQNEDPNTFKPQAEIKKIFNFNLFEYLKGNKRVKITNTGKVALYIEGGLGVLPNQSTYMYVKKNSNEQLIVNALGDKIYEKIL